MKKVQLFESFIAEAFEVHYSDGVRAAKKFKSEKEAMSFTKEKIASGKCKEIAIYKDGPGFHSTADTEAVIAWWGDGSYLDNVSKKDTKLAAKKLDESVVTEAKAKGLDWVISELGDKPKCYDVASFVYDNYDKVTGLRKSMRNDEMDFPDEIMDVVDHYGLDIDEFTDCYGMAAESVVTEGVVSIKGGRIIAHKVLNKLVDMEIIPVKKKTEDLLETIAKVITDAKMESVDVNESAMSDIDLLAQEAKDFKDFVKQFKKEYKNMDAGSAKELEAWLQSVYDGAKTNESVVTEGKHWHVLSGNTWYTGSDFSTNPADAMKYDDIMSATKVAKKVGGMVHVMTDEEMTKAIKKFGKNESKVTEAVAPAGLTKAETKKVAETYAKAIAKHDGCKCTVNAKSLEEDSFDLDIDGEAYAGGSYIITADGDVINMAVPEKPVYGQIESTVDQIIKNLKK